MRPEKLQQIETKMKSDREGNDDEVCELDQRKRLGKVSLQFRNIDSSMWIHTLCGLGISQIRELLSQVSLRFGYIESIWVNSTIS